MNNGWTFGIVTGGNQNDILKECIKKIQDEFLNVDNYEIIVVGNTILREDSEFKGIKFINFNENQYKIPDFFEKIIKFQPIDLKNDLCFKKPGWITRKKNIIAQKASYDKLCLMHDYVGVEPGWKKAYAEYGEDWDICMNQILNKNGQRHRDWMGWDHPEAGAGLMPYDKYTKYMYISGTYFCVKTDFFLKNPLDEKLFWGEGEDVEWSLRVRELTEFKMNVNAVVKYLKLKPENDAPYEESWMKNTEKLYEIFSNAEEPK